MNKQDWITLIASKPTGLTVNRKYCVQLKDYAILRKLIREGVLKRERSGTKHCKHTRLILVQKILT